MEQIHASRYTPCCYELLSHLNYQLEYNYCDSHGSHSLKVLYQEHDRLNLPQMTWENFQTFVYTQHFVLCISLLQVYK